MRGYDEDDRKARDLAAGRPERSIRPNFQAHHQPFNYLRSSRGTIARAAHLRDAGIDGSPRTNRFMADVAQVRLPPVTFYKPQGDLNMHAGYSDVDAGDHHFAQIVVRSRKVRNGSTC